VIAVANRDPLSAVLKSRYSAASLASRSSLRPRAKSRKHGTNNRPAIDPTGDRACSAKHPCARVTTSPGSRNLSAIRAIGFKVESRFKRGATFPTHPRHASWHVAMMAKSRRGNTRAFFVAGVSISDHQSPPLKTEINGVLGLGKHRVILQTAQLPSRMRHDRRGTSASRTGPRSRQLALFPTDIEL